MAAFFQKLLGGQPADPSRVLPVEDAGASSHNRGVQLMIVRLNM